MKPSRRLLPILLTLLALLTGRPAVVATVTWNFDYSGSAQFDTSATGLARRAALESAAATVSGWLNHTATVTMKVTSTNENSSTLASAGSGADGTGTNGFGLSGYVRSKILTGVGNSSGADGTVDCNFFHNWALGDAVPSDAYDFKSTMIHELLHALGFSSDIKENGDGPFKPAGSPDEWTLFDKFLTNAAGQPIINPTTFALNLSRWNAASTGGGTSGNPSPNGLYFSGPHAMAANGGIPVRIYSPSPWKDGSSGSHLDDLFYDQENLMMESATEQGLGARTLTPVEFGILKDLGYDLIQQGSNANLASLGFSAGTPTPAFAAATTAYSFSVPNATASTTVTAARAEANAALQVQLNGGSFSALTSGAASSPLALNVGSNSVVVRVTAQDGTTVKNYATTINRAAPPSSNADLASLGFSAGTPTPAFAAATTAYSFSVPNATATTTVTAARAEANAALQVQLNGGSFSALTSGAASSPLALNVGSNSVVVRVTAQDGTTVKNYATTITREAAAATPVAGTNLGLIPDNDPNGGREVQFGITGRTGVVTAVSVQFTLSPAHGYASDLSVELIAPDNTSAAIFGLSADDNSDLGGPYTFADSAAGSLASAVEAAGDSLVASGTYRAANAGTLTVLNSVFAGRAPNGNWRLRFIDSASPDTGSVSQASLNLTTSTTPPTSQARAAITLLPDRSRLFSATGLAPDTSYRLQGTGNLSSWTVLQTVTSDPGGTVSYTDTVSLATRGRLYYYRLIPAP